MDELSIAPSDNVENRFYFPLRSNVQYFDTQEAQLSLENRIKQASVLFDTLLFESGVYMGHYWGDHRVVESWMPFEILPDDYLDKIDKGFKPVGMEPSFKIDGIEFGRGRTERAFYSQFHGVLGRNNLLDAPWITVGNLDLHADEQKHADKLGIDDHEFISELLPDNVRVASTSISKNLNRDLMVANVLDAPVSMDNLFAPLVHTKAKRERPIAADGLTALEVVVPDWSGCSWEEIAEVRSHPSIMEFRRKMAEIERFGRIATEKSDLPDLQREIWRTFSEELLEEVRNAKPRPLKVVRDVLVDLVASPIPFLSTFITGAKGANDLRSSRRSWTATFFKLTEHRGR